MTLDQAIFDLQQKGLPCPSAISVFFLYNRIGDCYNKDESFEVNFSELLKVQQTIQENYQHPI
jgi:hypothetical protein